MAERSLNQFIIESAEYAIREFGMYRLAGATASLFAVLAALGLLVDLEIAGLLALAGLLLLLVLTILALMIDRRRLYRREKRHLQILTRYSKSIDALQVDASFDIALWDETITLDSRGRATILRKFTLRLGETQMPAFWTSVLLDPAPETYAYRDKVRVSVGYLSEDGTESVSIPHTTNWHDHKLIVYMHFMQEPPPGAIVRTYAQVRWPSYFNVLDNGIAVPNEYRFLRQVDEFRLRVVFAQKYLRKRRVVTEPIDRNLPCTQTVETSGNVVVDFKVEHPDRDRPLGYTMQLRGT